LCTVIALKGCIANTGAFFFAEHSNCCEKMHFPSFFHHFPIIFHHFSAPLFGTDDLEVEVAVKRVMEHAEPGLILILSMFVPQLASARPLGHSANPLRTLPASSSIPSSSTATILGPCQLTLRFGASNDSPKLVLGVLGSFSSNYNGPSW
jgi:hypothetical protein